LYVADRGNHTIRKVTPAGVVTTIAGAVGQIGSTNGSASAARFNYPWGIAYAPNGNLYITDQGGNLIRMLTPDGIVSTVAGTGVAGGADGAGNVATFSGPIGITADPDGNLIVADSGGHTIRRITTTGVVSTIGGAYGAFATTDGAGTAARFKAPQFMAFDQNGALYVADRSNYTIRKGVPTIATNLTQSTLGAPVDGTSATIGIGSLSAAGVLVYSGTGETTNRAIDLSGTTGGAVLEQSGTGSLKFVRSFTASGAGSKTLVLQGSTAGSGEIAGAIVNSSSLNTTALFKQGTGKWTLSGASTYSGGTTLAQGTLVLGSPGALGTGTLTIYSGANLDASRSLVLQPQREVWNGNFTFLGSNSLDLSGGSVSLTSDATVTVSAGSLTVGNLSGAYALGKAGPGTLVLSGTNSYTGATTVLAGTLILNGPNAFPSSSTLSVGSGSTVLLQNGAPIPFSSGAGTLLYLAGTPASVGVGDVSGSSSVLLSGSSTLTKVGSGSVALTNSGSYTGKSSVWSGALSVSTLNKVTGGTAFSSLGAPTTAANGIIDLGSLNSSGTLVVTGSAQTSDRVINLAGGNPFTTYISSDFTTAPAGATLSGVAAVSNGECVLTPNQGGALGYLVYNTLPVNPTVFTAQFDYRAYDGGGADGTSFNYGAITTVSGTEGGIDMTAGLVVSMIEYGSNRIEVKLNGGLLQTAYVNLYTSAYQKVIISIDANNKLSISVAGAVVISNLDLTSTYGSADKSTWKFGFASRCGGVTDKHSIDNFSVFFAGPGWVGGVAGSGVIDQSGTGALVLTGGVSASGQGAKTLTLQGSTSGTGEISGVIVDSGSGATSLTKTGTGLWKLSGANTYSGGTRISQGTLVLGNAAALGTGSLTISPGATLDVSSGVTFPTWPATWSGSLTFLGSSALNISSGSAALSASSTVTVLAGSLTVGNISGSADLSKDGVGTLVLSGTNTYTGTTTVLAGTLIINGANAMPLGSAVYAGTGSTILLQNGASIASYSGGGNLAYAAGSPAVIGAGNVTGNSAISISGTSTLTKTGTGTTTLTLLSAYTGKTSIQAGALSVSTLNRVTGGTASSSLGAPTTPANGTIDLGSLTATGTLLVTGSAQTTDRVINLAGTTGGGVIDQSGTGALVLTGSVTATGAGAKTLTLQGSTSGTGEISGVIANNSGTNTTALLKQGTGKWILSGTNTYSGGTTVSQGTLRLGSASAIGTGSLTLNAGVTLEVASPFILPSSTKIWNGNFNVLTSGSLDLTAGSLVLQSNSTVTIAGTGMPTGGVIASYAFNGDGNDASANAQAFTSSTGVTYGVGWDGTVSGAAAFNGSSSFLYRSSLSQVPGSQMTISAWIKTSGDGSIMTLGRSITNMDGQQSLIVIGGSLKYWDYNNSNYGFNGATSTQTVNSGSWRHVAFVKNGTTGTYYVDGQPAGTATGIDVAHVGTDFSVGKDYRDNNNFFNGSIDDFCLYSRALSAQEIAVLAGVSTPSLSVANVSGGYGLSKDGPGTMIISGTNTYTGATTVLAGTLIINGVNALPAGSVLSASAGATVLLQNGAQVGSFLGAGSLVYGAGVAVSTGAGDVTGSSNILLSGSSSLTKVGVGSITLLNSGSFTGKTWIQNGALSVSTLNKVVGGTISSSLGAPTTAANGTIDLGSLTATGTLLVTGSAQTTDRVINLAGTTGGGVIDQSGSGALVFSSTLTATGAGSKTLTLQGSTAGTGQLSGAIVDNSVSNRTSLFKKGTGTWTLAAASTYSGGTTLAEGTLVLGNASALGTGSVTFSGGYLDNGSPLTILGSPALTWSGDFGFQGSSNLSFGSGNITMIGDRTLSVNGATLQFDGSITGGGALTKAGAGTLVLAGSNNLSSVNLTGGTLQLNSGNAAGSGTISTGTGSSVILSSADGLPDGLTHRWSFNEIAGTSLADSVGSANGAIVTPNGYSSTATLSSGTITLNGATRLGASYVKLPAGMLSGLTSMTLEIWSSINATAPWPYVFAFNDIEDFNAGIEKTLFVNPLIAGSNTQGQLSARALGSSYNGSYTASTVYGQVYHYAIVWDAANSQLLLYRDGTLLSTLSVAGHTLSEISSNVFYLGRSPYAWDGPANQSFREVRMYNRALSAAEIAASTAAGSENVLTVPTNPTFLNSITGSGSVRKVRSSSAYLTGSNSYSGGTTVSEGSLVLLSGNALGTGTLSIAGGASVVLNNPTDGIFAFPIIGAGQILSSGSATLTLSGANSFSGGVKLSSGTLKLANATALGTGTFSITGGALAADSDVALTSNNPILLGGSLAYQGSASLSLGKGAITLSVAPSINVASGSLKIGGNLTGTYPLTKSGAGTLILAGTNTYTGATTVYAGTLVFIGANSMPSASTITTVGTGVIRLQGGAKATNFIGSSNLSLASDADSTIGNGSVTTGTLSGILTGDGGLTKAGAGAITLSGANSFTGKTVISSGTLLVNSLNSVLNGLTTSNLGAPMTAANGTIDLGNLSSTATLTIGGAGFTTDRILNLAGTTGGGQINLIGTGTVKFTSDLTATGAGSKTLTLLGSSTAVGEIAGAIVDNSATNKTALAKQGTGTWILSGLNSYTGGTTVSGGSLWVGASGALGSGALTLFNGACLNFAPGSDGVYENAISGFGTVLVSGSGVVSLSGALTYQGDTVVSGGTLRLAAANGTAPVSLLPSFTDVRLDMGAALDINGSTQTVNSLSDSLYGGGGVVLNTNSLTAATLVLNPAWGWSSFSGSISGGGTINLSKTGFGTVSLSGVNTYTGTTTVLAGMLIFDGANSLPAGSALTVAEGATVILQNGAQPQSFNGAGLLVYGVGSPAIPAVVGGDDATGNFGIVLSGSSTLTKVGSGNVTIRGEGSYTGKSSVWNGALTISTLNSVMGGNPFSSLGAPNTAANGTIDLGSLSASGSLIITGPSQTTDRVINLAGGQPVTTHISADFSTPPAGAFVYGYANVSNGECVLTPAQSGSAGYLLFDALANNPTAFTAQFDYRVADGNGADGTSFNYGLIGYPHGDESGMTNTGLVVSLVEYGEQRVSVSLNGNMLQTVNVTLTGNEYKKVVLNIDDANQLSLSVGGVVLMSNVDLGSDYGTTDKSAWQFGFASRCGGLCNKHSIDNFSVFSISNSEWAGGLAGGGVLDQSGWGALVFTGGVTSTGAGFKTLTLQGSTAGSAQITGSIADNGSIAKTAIFKRGTGTWTLSGVNTYSGGTTLSEGILNLGSPSALGSGTFTILGGNLGNASPGALTLSGSLNQIWSGNFAVNGAFALNTGVGPVSIPNALTVTVNAPLFEVDGIVSGSATLTKAGNGTLLLAGQNTLTGNLNVIGGTLLVNSPAGAGQGPVTISNGASLRVGAAPLNPQGLTHRWSFNEAAGGVFRDSVGTADGFIFTPWGIPNAFVGGGSLKMLGGSDFMASYAKMPSGLLSGLTDLTVEVWASLDQLSYYPRIFEFGDGFNVGTELLTEFAMGEDTSYPFLAIAPFCGIVAPPGGVAPLDLGRVYHWAFVWDSASSTASFYRDGALLCSTSIAGHTLAERSSNVFWLGKSHYPNSTNTSATYAEVRLWNRALSPIEVSNNTTLGADVLPAISGNNSSGDFTFSTPVSGGGSLQKVGPNTVTLSGPNTYTGPTTVLEGTLIIDGPNALPAGSALTVASGAMVVLQNGANLVNYVGAGALSYSGNITLGADDISRSTGLLLTGSSTLTKVGNGALTLTGASTYTGKTSIQSGALGVTSLNSIVSSGSYTWSTLAGRNGEWGYSDGTGSGARFNWPSGVALDGAGNVYVADSSNHVIRKITNSGEVSTFAGMRVSDAWGEPVGGYSDGIASAARFSWPSGVAVDGLGNLYVADRGNHVIRKISSNGEVSTFAGASGQMGYADGIGSAARFNSPGSVALDGAGNLYVADVYNRVIRKITSNGEVSTFAGTPGQDGYADGTGSNARFAEPKGVAVDGFGNVYVADTNNCVIRKITSSGGVSTLAGARGLSGYADGTGGNARFSWPSGVAVDGAGNVYVTDMYNQVIRKVTSSGEVSTLAGSVYQAGYADGGGINARFNSPDGVAVDGSGNLYVADSANQLIRKGVPARPTPLTSASSLGAPTDPANATIDLGSLSSSAALVYYGTGESTSRTLNLAGTTGGALLDQAGGGLLRFTGPVLATGEGSKTLVLQGSTFGAGELAGVISDNSPTNTTSLFKQGTGTWTLSGANTYSGGTTLAQGTLVLGSASALGTGTLTINQGATLDVLPGVAFPPTPAHWNGSFTFLGSNVLDLSPGAAFLTANSELTVLASTLTVGNISGNGGLTKTGLGTLILSGSNTYSGATNVLAGTLILDGINALPPGAVVNASPGATVLLKNNAQLMGVQGGGAFGYVPGSSAVLGGGNVSGQTAVILSGASSLTKIGSGTLTLTGANTYTGKTSIQSGALGVSSLNSIVTSGMYNWTTLAGAPQQRGYADGIGSSARFNNPYGVAVDGLGNVYVADRDNNVIRKITSGGEVSTFAGVSGQPGYANGIGSAARFNWPNSVTADRAGNVYVADSGNYVIRKITGSGEVSTFAGASGQSGYADGIGSATRFGWLGGVTVDGMGNVYAADLDNNVIRKITSGGEVSTFAGVQPGWVAVDGSGNVYVADSGNYVIRKITSSGEVSTFAGALGQSGYADGIGSAARFGWMGGMTVDGLGNVYVADSGNYVIRKITSSGEVSTFAGMRVLDQSGHPLPGYADGIGSAARFYWLVGVTVDGAGNVYVADAGGHTIRKGASDLSTSLVSSSLGTPTDPANAIIDLGSLSSSAALVYYGTGESTSRALNLAGTTGGALLDQSGGGLLRFTGPVLATGEGSK
ncbi:MAG: autotransporter-associated beta strand repeat-containing protein, partial [Verrucomicrobiota bacterium]